VAEAQSRSIAGVHCTSIIMKYSESNIMCIVVIAGSSVIHHAGFYVHFNDRDQLSLLLLLLLLH
jgi:hypothetical protein